MTASAGNRTRISRSRVSVLNRWTLPDSLHSIFGELNPILWCYFSPYLWLRIMRQAAIFIKIPTAQTTTPTCISEKLGWLISSALLLLLMFGLLSMSLGCISLTLLINGRLCLFYAQFVRNVFSWLLKIDQICEICKTQDCWRFEDLKTAALLCLPQVLLVKNEDLKTTFLTYEWGAAVTRWIALAAHGHWVVSSNPIRVIGGVRKGIQPQLLLCSKDKVIPRPAQKEAQFRVSHRVWRL